MLLVRRKILNVEKCVKKELLISKSLTVPQPSARPKESSEKSLQRLEDKRKSLEKAVASTCNQVIARRRGEV